MKLRFHLDEHIAFSLAEALRRRNIDVTTTADAKLLAAADEKHLLFAATQGRCLITNDAGFLRQVSEGVEHWGVAYCHRQKYAVRGLIRQVFELYDSKTAEEMRSLVVYL